MQQDADRVQELMTCKIGQEFKNRVLQPTQDNALLEWHGGKHQTPVQESAFFRVK